MKNAISVILFVISSMISYAQSNDEFFVSDVNTIEYVTVSFCVDSLGTTYNVAIVPEMTTYKNIEFCQQLISLRKSISFFADSKLVNDCHFYPYRIINEKYKTKILTSSECEECVKFHEGIFTYDDPIYPDVIIDRKAGLQSETHNGNVSKYYLEWISPCKYTLTFLKVDNKNAEYLVGEKIYIEIIDISDTGTYVYRSNLLNRTIITGKIRKL